MAASPQMIKSALRDWLSGGRSLDSEFHRSGSPLTPIPAHPPARDDDIGERPSRHFDRSEAEWRNLTPPNDRKAGLRPPVISTEAKRSGEISPSDSTGDITVEDLSTQSIMGAFPICPIPTRSPARDDGVGEHPSRHFDRSEAEWRNLLSLMVHEAWRPKISGLRVPIEPCIPARAPLEMTRGSP